MRSLLYVDWCVARGNLPRVLAVCLALVCPVVLLSNDGGRQAPGVAAACVVTTMVAFYGMLCLFTADEQGEWERARMAFPVTARHVVRARYAFVALCALGAAVTGAVVGVVASRLLGMVVPVSVPRGGWEVTAAALGVGVGVLVYLALIMPAAFKWGMAKSRAFFSLPFLLFLLLELEPVRRGMRGMASWLEGLSSRLGGPGLVVVLAVVLTAACYVGSMALSERIYSKREL